MDISWGCGWFLATLFVVLNLIGQLGGVAMVLLRIKVDIACGLLFGIVFLQVRQIILLLHIYVLSCDVFAEDLGTGHCHIQGVGWLGDQMDPTDIVSNLTEATGYILLS